MIKSFEKSATEMVGRLDGLEKIGIALNSTTQPIKLQTEAEVRKHAPEGADEIMVYLANGGYCAAWNKSDIGLSCGDSGRRSHCVWASGWGWVYFNDFNVVCAGTTLQVCYSSYGLCG